MSISYSPPPTNRLITVSELLQMPDDGRVIELVRGKIIEMQPTMLPHGKVCFAIAAALAKYLDEHDVGHVAVNDCGIMTERDPDSVRGADAALGSYQRTPKDTVPTDYWPASPELVFEVLRPSDRPGATFTKVSEYLAADVLVVVVVDPEERKVHVHAKNRPQLTLDNESDLNLAQFLPEVMPGCSIPVRDFFKSLPPLP